VTATAPLEKAERALLAARRALERNDTETAADRGYYAVFYVKIGQIDPESGAILARLQGLRLVADYTLDAIPSPDAARAIAEADRFLALARALATR